MLAQARSGGTEARQTLELLPFVQEQLPLSLKAGGQILPVRQSPEPTAEHLEEEVSPRGGVAMGHSRALFQVSSHLLEKSKAETSCTFTSSSRCFSVPKCKGGKSLGLPVCPDLDPDMGVGETSLRGFGEKVGHSFLLEIRKLQNFSNISIVEELKIKTKNTTKNLYPDSPTASVPPLSRTHSLPDTLRCLQRSSRTLPGSTALPYRHTGPAAPALPGHSSFHTRHDGCGGQEVKTRGQGTGVCLLWDFHSLVSKLPQCSRHSLFHFPSTPTCPTARHFERQQGRHRGHETHTQNLHPQGLGHGGSRAPKGSARGRSPSHHFSEPEIQREQPSGKESRGAATISLPKSVCSQSRLFSEVSQSLETTAAPPLRFLCVYDGRWARGQGHSVCAGAHPAQLPQGPVWTLTPDTFIAGSCPRRTH